MAEKKKAGKRKTKPRKAAAKKRTAKQREVDAEAVAKDLTHQPEATGRGSSKEIVERNVEIFRASMRGLQPESLAPLYNLSAETIRTIVRDMRREIGRLDKIAATEIIEEYVLGLEAGIDELAAVSAQSKGSARVAAITARLQAMRDKIKVMQETGYLPRELGTMNVRISIDEMTRKAIKVLQENKVPTKVMVEMMAAWDPDGYMKWRKEQEDAGHDVSKYPAIRPALPAGTQT